MTLKSLLWQPTDVHLPRGSCSPVMSPTGVFVSRSTGEHNEVCYLFPAGSSEVNKEGDVKTETMTGDTEEK